MRVQTKRANDGRALLEQAEQQETGQYQAGLTYSSPSRLPVFGLM